MTTKTYSTSRSPYCIRLAQLLAISILCLTFSVSCASTDKAYDVVKQALTDIDKDPLSSYRALDANLVKVRDKNVIPFLLNYFEGAKSKEHTYPSILGLIGLYLERISGIQSHVNLTIGGPIYSRSEDWNVDVAQWQNWWNANNEYIYWDEQAQSLQVRLH